MIGCGRVAVTLATQLSRVGASYIFWRSVWFDATEPQYYGYEAATILLIARERRARFVKYVTVRDAEL